MDKTKSITPSDESEPRYAVFIIDGGVFSDTCLVPFTKKQAIEKALGAIYDVWQDARTYKNGKYMEEADEEHSLRREAVQNLQSVNLNDSQELIIVEIKSE